MGLEFSLRMIGRQLLDDTSDGFLAGKAWSGLLPCATMLSN